MKVEGNTAGRCVCRTTCNFVGLKLSGQRGEVDAGHGPCSCTLGMG